MELHFKNQMFVLRTIYETIDSYGGRTVTADEIAEELFCSPDNLDFAKFVLREVAELKEPTLIERGKILDIENFCREDYVGAALEEVKQRTGNRNHIDIIVEERYITICESEKSGVIDFVTQEPPIYCLIAKRTGAIIYDIAWNFADTSKQEFMIDFAKLIARNVTVI